MRWGHLLVLRMANTAADFGGSYCSPESFPTQLFEAGALPSGTDAAKHPVFSKVARPYTYSTYSTLLTLLTPLTLTYPAYSTFSTYSTYYTYYTLAPQRCSARRTPAAVKEVLCRCRRSSASWSPPPSSSIAMSRCCRHVSKVTK